MKQTYPYQIEMQDPDPYQSEKHDPDPDKMVWIRNTDLRTAIDSWQGQ
jgi:hypothetical protein